MPHLPFQELPVADPGTADLRSPARYLTWVARHQLGQLVVAAIFGSGWMLCQALLWAAVGAAIDHGIVNHSVRGLFTWVGVVMALGALQAIFGALRHQMAVTNWMLAAYRTIQLVGRHVSQTGTSVTDVVPAGDVVNTVAADAMRVGGAFDVVARFVGAIVAWVVVAVILLSTSVELGLIVLIGVPVLASLTTPLMRPLHATQAAQREAAGRLAALASDTVAGLRILRGVGGEAVFYANYQRQSDLVRQRGNRVATPQAALESGQVLLPAILTAIVTLLGAHDVMAGTLQAGQLVAFFGYATFLTTPLRTAIEFVIAMTRAHIGAGRVLKILRITARVGEPSAIQPWPDVINVYRDARTGIRLERGVFAALVTQTPSEAMQIADRLGRFVPEVDDVTIDGVPLTSFSLSDTRRHIVVDDIEPRLFSGELRAELALHDESQVDDDDDRILNALSAASALDILDALDEGLATSVDERGRRFSGGQRQRLSLARAILCDAQLLILVEPTSAVDTHTEGRIAARLRGARRDRTTLVATTSPLILHHADEVILVVDGHVVDVGTHRSLLAKSPQYRHIVMRDDLA